MTNIHTSHVTFPIATPSYMLESFASVSSGFQGVSDVALGGFNISSRVWVKFMDGNAEGSIEDFVVSVLVGYLVCW